MNIYLENPRKWTKKLQSDLVRELSRKAKDKINKQKSTALLDISNNQLEYII